MIEYHDRFQELRAMVESALSDSVDPSMPSSLLEPARYILAGGGKRIRPVLALLACEAAGGDASDAVSAGAAVEILHNFTLVHDDIMDNALQRRGRATVHKRWDANVAILVGDELIGLAYRTLLKTVRGDIRELTSLFTSGMIEVCEGQAFDKEFEGMPCIDRASYFMMIGKKTGRLVTLSAEMGAVIAEADANVRRCLTGFASSIGRAFQVQDDLLDVIAEEERFGKAIGGDILEGKKTFLLVEALARASGEDLELLQSVAERRNGVSELVPRVTEIYRRLGIIGQARRQIREDTDAALEALAGVPPSRARDMLEWFAGELMERTH